MMQKKLNLHFCLVLLAAIMWGFAGVFVRTAKKMQIGEMELVFLRAVVSALILFILIIIKNKQLIKIKFRDLWLFISAGLFSIVLFNFSYYKTMALTSLSVAAVLLYTAPFFVVIISAVLFKEKLTIYKTVACIVAFFGCCFVSQIFDVEKRISGIALFFGLLTGLGYALYTIFGELLIKRKYHSLTITFYMFLSAAICCLPFINIKDMFNVINYQPKAIYVIVLMALFNTVIPYICYTTGLLGVEPSVAPIIATLELVVASVVGMVFFKEMLKFSSYLGIVLVIGSVMILNLKPLTLKANAKINLSLNILGKRQDIYHEIDTVMQSISLGDRITLKKSREIVVNCDDISLSNKENICYKAAKLFFEKTGINFGVTINIKKKIPIASGLGGGSSDAAAVLIGLNRLYGTSLDDLEFLEMAKKLGADVSFFILGGTIRADGIGEKLTKLNPLKKGWFVLLKDENKKSTKEMYENLDTKPYKYVDTELVIKNIENNDLNGFCNATSNSFETVWENCKTQKILKEYKSMGVLLSGSGPTWYAVFQTKKQALKVYKDLKSKKYNCFIAKPLEKSVYFE